MVWICWKILYTLQVLEVLDCPHPKFKQHLDKSMERDLDGAFSHTSYGVLLVEDIRIYIHAKLEMYNYTKLADEWYN